MSVLKYRLSSPHLTEIMIRMNESKVIKRRRPITPRGMSMTPKKLPGITDSLKLLLNLK